MMSQKRNDEILLAKFKKKYKVDKVLDTFLLWMAKEEQCYNEDYKLYDEINQEEDFDYAENAGGLDNVRAYHAWELLKTLAKEVE